MRNIQLLSTCLIFYAMVCLTCIECRNIDTGDSLYDDCDRGHSHRVIGGEKAVKGEFKGIVFLSITPKNGGCYICGSSLIHPEVLLTAAHCFYDEGGKSEDFVLEAIGDSLIPTSTTDESRQVRSMKSVVVHGEYNHKTKANDIALIFLDKPFEATTTFGVYKISAVDPVDNEKCRVAGWGYTVSGDIHSASEELLKANVTVIPLSICNDQHHLDGKIQNGSFCAGVLAGGHDTCQGDSGGGLICDNVLKGIVSWGKGCGEPDLPGVFVNVNKYRTWIVENSDNKISLSPDEGSSNNGTSSGSGTSSAATTLIMPILPLFIGIFILCLFTR